MKRYLIAATIALGFSGVAAAQGTEDVFILLNNIDNTVNGLVLGLGETGVAYFSGDVSGTAEALGATLTGVAVNLSAGTPGAFLGPMAEQLGNTLVSAGAPLFSALDGPAMQLAALGAPLGEPAIAFIQGIKFDLKLEFEAVALPGIDGLALPSSEAGGLSMLPALGDLLGALSLPGL